MRERSLRERSRSREWDGYSEVRHRGRECSRSQERDSYSEDGHRGRGRDRSRERGYDEERRLRDYGADASLVAATTTLATAIANLSARDRYRDPSRR
jgi:hypothetical protein